MTRPTRVRRLVGGAVALALAGLVATAGPALAATATWTGAGGDGLWLNATNWTAGPAPNDDVVFPDTAPANQRAVNNNIMGPPEQVASFTVEADGYTFTGSDLALGVGGYESSFNPGTTEIDLGFALPAATVPFAVNGIANTTTINGDLTANGGQPVAIQKTGSGALVLNGTNPITGDHSVSGGGWLFVNGELEGTLSVTGSGSTLAGVGTVGPTTASAGGVVTPGNADNTNHDETLVTGALTIGNDGRFAANLGETQNNKVSANGNVTLEPGSKLLVTLDQNPPAVGAAAVIVANETANPVVGTFDGLPEGATVLAQPGDVPFRVSYVGGDGNDVTVTRTGGAGGGLVRLSGPDRVATAIAISQNQWPNPASAAAVVVARSTDYPDALAGTPLAVVRNGPLLLTAPDALDARVLTEIQRVLPPGGPVVILGGDTALSPAVQNSLTGAGFAVTRIGGADRFATSIAIANALPQAPTEAVVATGRNFPDALTGGAGAGHVGGAVLLSDNATLPDSVRTYLLGLNQPVVALGGPAAQAVASAGIPNVTPLVGADRYATATLAADHFFAGQNPTSVGIASGETFPDGLAGGVHITLKDGPLLLTQPSSVPAALQTWLQAHPAVNGGFLYGGTVAVSDATKAAIEAIIAT